MEPLNPDQAAQVFTDQVAEPVGTAFTASLTNMIGPLVIISIVFFILWLTWFFLLSWRVLLNKHNV